MSQILDHVSHNVREILSNMYKDPFTAKYAPYLREIFPGSKHILMIRDGRSVAHSIITHNVTISGYDLKRKDL